MSFENQHYLLILPLLLLPIILHFISLQRYKNFYFTNILSLRSLEVKDSKLKSIKDYFVLLNRLLFLCSVIFLFAKPFFFSIDTSLSKKPNLVIYLDNSYSMQQMVNDKEKLSTAISHVTSLVKDNKDMTFHFVSNDKLENLNVDFTYDDISAKLTEISYTNESFNLNAFLNLIRNSNLLDNSDIYIFSDFQNIDLNTLQSDTLLKGRINAFLLSDDDFIHNVFIDTISTFDFYKPDILDIELRSNLLVADNINVSIYIDSSLIITKDISFSTSKKLRIPIKILNDYIGKSGKVVVANDDVIYDNEFYFTVPKINISNVLLVKGNNSNISYLEKVLANNEKIDLSISSVQTANYNLNDIIIFEGYNSKDLGIIKNLLNVGKKVILFPNEDLSVTDIKVVMNAFGINVKKNIQNNLMIKAPVKGSKFYDGVFNSDLKNVEMPFVNKNYSFDSRYKSILKFEDNSSAFISAKVGEGELLVSGFSLSDNSSLVNHSFFVPLIYNLVESKIESDFKYYSFLGQNVSLKVNNYNSEHVLKILDGNGDTFIPSQVKIGKYTRIMLPYEMGLGMSTILLNDSIINIQAVNLQKNESEGSYLSMSELEEFFLVKDLKGDNISLEGGSNSSISYLDNPEIWKYLVFLALFFLLVEILLLRVYK